MKWKKSSLVQKAVSAFLAFSMLAGTVQLPIHAAEKEDIYLPEMEISEDIINSGKFYIPTSNAEIDENAKTSYLFRIARGGDVLDEASVRLDIIDITAKYGEDYKIKIYNGGGKVQNTKNNRSLLEEILENKDEIEEVNYTDGIVSGEELTQEEMEELYQSDVEALAEYLDEAMGDNVTAEVISEDETDMTDAENESPAASESQNTDAEADDDPPLSLRKAKEIATGLKSDRVPMEGGNTFSEYTYSLLNSFQEELDSAYLEIKFARGEASKYIEVIPVDNKKGDGDRLFQLNLFAASDNAQISERAGINITILDDEAHEASVVSLSDTEYFPEDGYATVTVTRSGALNEVAMVRLETVAITAVEERDYSKVAVNVAFPYGITERCVNIPVRSDYIDIDETAAFDVKLSEPVSCEIGAIDMARVTISHDSVSFLLDENEVQEEAADLYASTTRPDATTEDVFVGPAHDLTAKSTYVSEEGFARKDGSEFHMRATASWSGAYTEAYFWFGTHYDYNGVQVEWELSSGKPAYQETTLAYKNKNTNQLENLYYGDTERWGKCTDTYYLKSTILDEVYFQTKESGGWLGKASTLKIYSLKPVLRPFEVSLVGADPMYFLTENGEYVENTGIGALQNATDVQLTGANNTGKGTAVKFSGDYITLTSSSPYSYIQGIKIVGSNGLSKVVKYNLPIGTTSASIELTNDFIMENLSYITFTENGKKGIKGQFSVQPIMGYYTTTITLHEDYRGEISLNLPEQTVAGSYNCRIKNAQTNTYLAAVHSIFSNAVTLDNGTDAYSIWTVEFAKDGTCYIDGAKSRPLSVYKKRSENGTEIVTKSDDQRFKLQQESDGTYAILTEVSEYQKGISVNGKKDIEQWEYQGETNQKWIIEFLSPKSGLYKIKNVNSGKYLQTESTTVKSNVVQGDDTKDERVLWTINKLYDGTFTIENQNGYYLDVYGANAANGTNIHTWEWNNTNAQKFRFVKVNGEDSFVIYTMASDYQGCVDINGRSTDTGANAHQWTFVDIPNQKWILEPVTSYTVSLHKGDTLSIRQTVSDEYSSSYTSSRIRFVSKKNSGSKQEDVLRKYDVDKQPVCVLRNEYSNLDIYPHFDKKNNQIVVRVPNDQISKFDATKGIFTAQSVKYDDFTDYIVVTNDAFATDVYFEMTAVTKNTKSDVAIWNPIHTTNHYSQETFYFYSTDDIEENIIYLRAEAANSTMYSISATAHYADAALTQVSERNAWLAADGVYVIIGKNHYGISNQGKLDTIPMYGKSGCDVIYKTVASGIEEYKTVTLSTRYSKTFQTDTSSLRVYDIKIGDIVARSYDTASPYPSGVSAADRDLISYQEIPITDTKSYYLNAYIANNHATYKDSDGVERIESVTAVDFIIYDSVTNQEKYVISGAKSFDDGRQWSIVQSFTTEHSDKYLPSDRIYVRITTDRYIGNGKSAQLDENGKETGEEVENSALKQTIYAPINTGLTLTSSNRKVPVTHDIDFDTNMDFVKLPLIGTMNATFNVKFISLTLTELENGKQRLSFGYIPKTDEEKKNESNADDDKEYGLIDLKAKANGLKEFGQKVGSKHSVGMKSWGLYPIFGIYIDFGIREVDKYTTHTSKELVFCGGGLYTGISGSFRLVQYIVIGWFPLFMGTEGELTILGNAGFSVANEKSATMDALMNTQNSFSNGIAPDTTLEANVCVKAYVGAGLCGTLSARGGIQFDGSYIFRPSIVISHPDFHMNGLYLTASVRVWIEAILFAIPIPVMTITEQRYGYYKDVEDSKKDNGSLFSFRAQDDSQDNSQHQQGVFMRERNSMDAEWMPDSGISLFSTFEQDGSSTVLMENGYDRADPQLIDIGDGRILLVFVADGGESRTDENRTALMYSVYDKGTWSDPQIIQDDGTADFEPDLCDAGDNVLVSWISRAPEASSGTPYDYFRSLEVYTTTIDKATLEIGTIERLTNDNFYDSAPVGMYDELSGDMTVYYLKSDIKDPDKNASGSESDQLLAAISPTKNESVIVYMLYDASKKQWARDYYYDNEVASEKDADYLIKHWGGQRFLSSPMDGFIEDGEDNKNDPIIYDFDGIAYNGLGVYTYTVDKDNNMDTANDRELFVQVYNFASHSTFHPIRITDDDVSDARPQLVRNDNNTYLFWLQNDRDVCYINLTELIKNGINEKGQIKENIPVNKSIVFFNEADNDVINPSFGSYNAFVDQDNNLFITWLQPVTYKYEDDDEEYSCQEVFASAFIRTDIGSSWSDGVQLTYSGMFNDEVAMLTDTEGNLLTVNNQYSIDFADETLAATDVKLVATNFKTVGSLEVAEVTFSDETPETDSTIEASIRVKNTGLKPANGYHIKVYEEIDGIQTEKRLLEQDVATMIPPSASDYVTFQWTMPESFENLKSLSLSISVKEGGMDEIYATSSDSLKFEPDYKIVSYEVTEDNNGFYASYTIANNGNCAAHSENGDKLVIGFNDIYHTDQKIEMFLSAPIGDLGIGEEKTFMMPLTIDEKAFAFGSTSAFMEVQNKEGKTINSANVFDIMLKHPYDITVNGNPELDTITIEEGQRLALSATYAPKDYYLNGDILYTTEDTAVAGIENHTLIGISEGTTKLEVRVAPYGGYKLLTVVVTEAEEPPYIPPIEPESPPVEPETPPKDPEPPVEEENAAEKFTDVEETDWFYSSVNYVVAGGYFRGTSDTTFSPQMLGSRGMLVTVLGRLEGVTPSGTDSGYSDVNADQYYAPYVAWATENGIVRGYGDNIFGGDDSITREQMAIMIANFLKYKTELTLKEDAIAYTDEDAISDWALDAVKLTTQLGIFTGNGAGAFMPKNYASRAEIAIVIERLDTLLNKWNAENQ